MKQLQAAVIKRFVAGLLAIAIIVGVSAIAMRAPTQNQNSVARSLKSIQTDKAKLFYADQRVNRTWYVEMVLPATAESKAATEHLKRIAAIL
jgi:hypothetical protein